MAARQSTVQQAWRAGSLGREAPQWRRGSVALPRESAIWETADKHSQDDIQIWFDREFHVWTLFFMALALSSVRDQQKAVLEHFLQAY